MPKRLLRYPRTQPARAIVAGVSFFTILTGIFLLTPWYVPITGPPLSGLYGFSYAASAVAYIGVGAFGMFAARRNTPRWIARAAFVLFMWSLFLALGPVALGYGSSFRWIIHVTMAYVMAVVNIQQSYVDKQETPVAEGVGSE